MSLSPIDRTRSALLVMDAQRSILDYLPDQGRAVIAAIAPLVQAARAASMPILYVTVGFRPGFPEAHPRNKGFAALRASGRAFPEVPGSDIPEILAPRAGEPLVVKRRVSAFHGTELEVLLRAQSIDTLILTGISTSGVVLSTVRHAADADYGIVVVEDACTDADPEVHRVLTTKVFPRQCTVVSSAELASTLANA